MIKLKIITNRKLCLQHDLVARIERVIKEYLRGSYLDGYSIDSIIVREKDLAREEYIELFKKIKDLVDSYNNSEDVVLGLRPRIDVFAHNHMDIAVDMGIKNIHLPLDTLRKNKNLVDKFEKIGVSCHSLREIKEAIVLGATYVTFSHVFVTDCKKGLEPRGLDELRNVAENTKIPVYALGGIDHTNAISCINSGASGVVMMSNIMKE